MGVLITSTGKLKKVGGSTCVIDAATTINGTITIADNSVTVSKIAAGALAATVAGRAKMADGYFTEAQVTAKFDAGAITTGILIDDCLAASAAGRAKMQDGFFTEAAATAKFAAQAITGSLLKNATVTKTQLATDAKELRNAIADPGNAGAIPVTTGGSCALTSAGVETRTLAIPTYVGQELILICDVYVGNITITSAQRINQAGNTQMVFGAAADFIKLVGVQIGGVLRWQVAANDGVALS